MAASGLKKELERGPLELAGKKVQELADASRQAEIKAYALLMQKSNDPTLKKLGNAAYEELGRKNHDTAEKILFIGVTYESAKSAASSGNREITDYISSIKISAGVPATFDVLVGKSSSILPAIDEANYQSQLSEARAGLAKGGYGPRTSKFISESLDKIELLHSESHEKAYMALNMVSMYVDGIVRNGIVRGHGREEVELAITGHLLGEDTSSLFSDGISRALSFVECGKIYRQWEAGLSKDLLSQSPELSSLMDEMRQSSGKGDLDATVRISNEMSAEVPRVYAKVIKEGVRSAANSLEKMEDAAAHYASMLKEVEGHPGYGEMVRLSEELQARIRQLRDRYNQIPIPSAAGTLPESIASANRELEGLSEQFSRHMASIQTYLHVGHMLSQELQYQKFRKHEDPQKHSFAGIWNSQAISGLEGALKGIAQYASTGSIAHKDNAARHFSRAVDGKRRLISYFYSDIKGENLSDINKIAKQYEGGDITQRFSFYNDGQMALFNSLLDGGIGKVQEGLRSDLAVFEDSVRLSTGRVFVSGEGDAVSAVAERSRGIISARLSRMKGGGEAVTALGDKIKLRDADVKKLQEIMEKGETRAQWAEFAVSLFPPAFVSMSIRSIAKESNVEGRVSWHNWAMLGLSFGGAFGKGVTALSGMGKAGNAISKTYMVGMGVGSVGMLGFGAYHTYSQFASGNYEKGLAEIAKFSIPLLIHSRGALKNFAARRLRHAKNSSLFAKFRGGAPKPVKHLKTVETPKAPALAVPIKGQARQPPPLDKNLAKTQRLKVKLRAEDPKVFKDWRRSATRDNAYTRENKEFIFTQRRADKIHGTRELIPIGKGNEFSAQIEHAVLIEGKSAMLLSMDKSGLGSLNNISSRFGDLGIDLYIESIRRMSHSIWKKYGNKVEICINRSSKNSDEIYISILSKDTALLRKIRSDLPSLQFKATNSVLRDMKHMTRSIEGLSASRVAKAFRDPEMLAKSTIDVSEIFVPSDGGMMVRGGGRAYGKGEMTGAMLQDAERGMKLRYRRAEISKLRGITYEDMCSKYGIEPIPSAKLNDSIRLKGGRVDGVAVEVKLQLDNFNEQMFGEVVFGTVRDGKLYGTSKGLAEVFSNRFGMRGFNTFFGHGGTNKIITLVDDAAAAFAKSNPNISVQRIGPFKYVISGGDAHAHLNFKKFMGEHMGSSGVKASPAFQLFRFNGEASLISDLMITRGFGLKLSGAQSKKFLEGSNFIVTVLKDMNPTYAEGLFAGMDGRVRDALSLIFSHGRNSKVIRNTEDLFAYIKYIRGKKHKTPAELKIADAIGNNFLDLYSKSVMGFNLEAHQRLLVEAVGASHLKKASGL